jgi:hypothetical protein
MLSRVKLVDDTKHPECLPIVGAVGDEIVGAHMVGILRSQTDAVPVIVPKATPFGLLCRDFQPLTPPDPLDALSVHLPSRCPKHHRTSAIVIATILAAQLDNVSN